MNRPSESRCDNCRFWRVVQRDAGVGECRREPPKIAFGTTPCGAVVVETHWPNTLRDEWCGEWMENRAAVQ